jgi:hypothetical protein
MFLEHQRGSVKNEFFFSNMTGIDMYQFMRSNLFFDATNLVDKVYGLLGIVGAGTVLDDLQPQLTNEVAEPSIQINYRKIVLQVYQHFTKYIINRGGDLSLLEMPYSRPSRQRSQSPKLDNKLESSFPESSESCPLHVVPPPPRSQF